MTTMNTAYYPPPMGDSRVGHRQSAGSHKRMGQGLEGAPNAVKWDTRGALVTILVSTLMPTTKAMLWRLKIYWVVHTFQVVEQHQIAIHKCPQFTYSFTLCSYWVVNCEHTPTPVCVLIIKYSFVCSLPSSNLKCLPGRRHMFIVVNHGLQPINPWVTVTLQSWHFDILIILDSELSPHPDPCLDFNMQVHWCMCIGGWHVYPCLCVNDEVRLYTVTFC